MVINQLAKATTDLGGAFSPERIKYSLEMTGLGLIAVFAVLALIWLILAIFKFFLYDVAKNKDEAASTHAPSKTAKKVESVPTEVVKSTANTENDATVATIIAAISAYNAEDPQLSEQYSNGFRVVSFKRVRGKASWNSKNN